MRVLSSTYESHGDVEPMVGLAVRLRAPAARRCRCVRAAGVRGASGRVGVPLVPIGQLARPMVHGAAPPAAADLPRRAAELVAAQFDTVAAVAEGCDALAAGGMMPAGV